MKYGENTYLVEEVVVFTKTHRFFVSEENFNSEIKVINDFDEAVSYVMH